jgi:LysR family hydrogen peroxide-inducible transcriptional activator
MTLTQLQYIISLDEHRNFIIASKACHISQPTLSVQIQKLEDYLQVTIFDRSRQPIEPTLLGKKVISQAREILRNTTLLEQMIYDEKDTVKGDFRLGIIPSVAGSLIPLFLRQFSTKFPDVKLTIIELKTDELIVKLKKDEIDAGIAATPLKDRELSETPLYWEPFQLFVHREHELYKKKEITQDQLWKQNILLMSEGNCVRTQVSQICKLKESFGANNSIDFESGNFQTLIELVKQNMGITLLPQLISSKLKSNTDMVRSFHGKVPVREIGILTRRTLVKKTISNALKRIIKDVIPLDLQTRTKKETKVINPLS